MNNLNFGQHVFDSVLEFADGGLRSTRLLFPSLIYGMLVSQGFFSHIDEDLTGVVNRMKIALTLLKGNRKINLPWDATGAVTGVGYTDPNTTTIFTNVQTPTSRAKHFVCHNVH